MKDWKALNLKCDAKVYDLLDEFANLSAPSKTYVVERAIIEYIDNHKNEVKCTISSKVDELAKIIDDIKTTK